MRIFLTGATGYIGTAVTSALIHAGHEVTALVRPKSSSARLERAGVRVVQGDLGTLGEHRETIGSMDAAIHMASDSTRQATEDASAIDVFTSIGDLHFLYTSGVWVFGNTGERMVDEHSPVDPIEVVAWRPAHERRVLDQAEGRSAVIRPGCVYGGTQSLLAEWFAAAEENRPLEIVGTGENRWAMVHEDDLADLYLKAVEERAAGILHGTDDSRASLDEMAAAVIEARGSASRVTHTSLDAARAALGGFAEALALDQHVSSLETRSRLGWEPAVSFLHSIERQWEEWRQAEP